MKTSQSMLMERGEGARVDGRINGWLKVHNPVHVGLASTKGIASAGPVGRIMAASYSSSRNSGANESCFSGNRTTHAGTTGALRHLSARLTQNPQEAG